MSRVKKKMQNAYRLNQNLNQQSPVTTDCTYVYVCVHIIVHNSATQYSREQFW